MVEEYEVIHGDCIVGMHEQMEPNSVDFAVFSPPFPSMYAYTSSESDIGNTDTLNDEAKLHLGFFYSALCRVLKPGRVACVHVCQIPNMKRSGGVGLSDFRGINIRIAKRAGLIYEYDWTIPKNPQAQAIRTRSRELQFAGLESDRARQRGAIADYILKFSKPGENAVPIVNSEVSRNDWIKWASSSWDDIIETDTLNAAEARSEEDTRHICPLQLEPIRRVTMMYSLPGELVFSPFTGIGSEGYVAIGGKSPKTGRSIHEPRRFFGFELKQEYHAAALKNLGKVQDQRMRQRTLL